MAELYITSQELVKTLKITTQELIETEKFFDSVPDDEWELTESKDYKVVNKTTGLREYTSSGAYTIARYLEATQKQTFWQRLTEWFTHTKREISKAFIKKHILDNSSSLVKRNGQFFVSRSDLVTIFKTRSDYLSKMADHTQKTSILSLKVKILKTLSMREDCISPWQVFLNCLTPSKNVSLKRIVKSGVGTLEKLLVRRFLTS